MLNEQMVVVPSHLKRHPGQKLLQIHDALDQTQEVTACRASSPGEERGRTEEERERERQRQKERQRQRERESERDREKERDREISQAAQSVRE